jgi:O-antigen ligase
MFVGWLFWRDARERPNITGALWLPLIWMLIICSRAVTQWLDIFGVHVGAVSVEEGSPIDAAVYYSLIAAGIYVLSKRQVSLSEFLRNNGWMTAFLLFGFLAIVWSDFPFVAFKRWTKVIGHPVMVLILMTEPDFQEALRRLMKRCAYVVVPVSILLIKYYPTIGRNSGPWATASMNNGIAMGKNLLGADCMILGLFFFWHLLNTWHTERGRHRRNELILTLSFLVMLWWLLVQANSSTATFSSIIGLLTLLFLGCRFVNRRLVGSYVLAAAAIFFLAESMFGISSILIHALGRNQTLTGRTELWQQLWEFRGNPIVGVGFESFWLGERLRQIGELYWWQANEAHNGYFETYLNLGVIGVFILVGWLVATFRRSQSEFITNFEFGRFRLSFFMAVLIYNWTESAFRSLHPVWFVFFIIALECPKTLYQSTVEPWDLVDSKQELEMANL